MPYHIVVQDNVYRLHSPWKTHGIARSRRRPIRRRVDMLTTIASVLARVGIYIEIGTRARPALFIWHVLHRVTKVSLVSITRLVHVAPLTVGNRTLLHHADVIFFKGFVGQTKLLIVCAAANRTHEKTPLLTAEIQGEIMAPIPCPIGVAHRYRHLVQTTNVFIE